MPLTTLPAKLLPTPRSRLLPTDRPLARATRLSSRDALVADDAHTALTARDAWSTRTAHGERRAAVAYRVLARYTDRAGRLRDMLALPGHGGSVLVVDRDAATWGDRRLVAHLAADEPLENAHLVCRHYLRDPRPRRCRRLAPEDLFTAPFSEQCELQEGCGCDQRLTLDAVELRDRHGWSHRLEPRATGRSIPELRWCRRQGADELGHDSDRQAGDPRPESVRDAIAWMEGYEPVRALTVGALARHRDDATISVAVLRGELQRIDASRIVLNRGLRRAVVHAMRTQGLSLSEIAYRCGKVKRDGKGNCSGETSWLSRRVGILPESDGDGEPTPWIHSEVLAMIAREGLGISPREVEL
jgi:hypothetical protein